jgi:DNA-binding winged helix-turn-helix (wHTH) protein
MPTSTAAVHVVAFGPYRLDTFRRELRRGGTLLHLTPRVFDTLVALIERRERVAGKAELMAALWPDRAVEEANLTQNVFTLRKLLRGGSEGTEYIATVPRRGYRFVAAVREVEAGEPVAVTRIEPRPPRRARRLMAAIAVAVAFAIAVVAPLGSHADEPRWARLIRTDAGRPPSRADRVRITVQRVDGATRRPRWEKSFESDVQGLAALHDQAARAIAAEIETDQAR